jgi:high-affinity K+ transport system ATPase subunit B
MTTKTVPFPLFERGIVKQAVVDSFRKLSPQQQMKNPVMFVVWVGSILTTLLLIQALGGHGEAPAGFIMAVTLWLWFTVLFANFAEAIAEGRSRAQAASMRKAKRDVQAKKLTRPHYGEKYALVPGTGLRKDDVVLVEAGDFIPGDGEVIEGVASVDESAITGESAPVIRRRLQRGDRRHAGVVRLAGGAHHHQSGRDFPGPHDRNGGVCPPPEDSERDRADHFAGSVDADLPVRDRHAVAVLAV